MKNKDCKVVQDLLPNYIEKLTSEETNQYIEEHLKSCKECQEMLESMKADLKIEIVKKDDREVEYIKKFNVKFKKVEYRLFTLIYTIIAILVVSIVVFFGRKYIIFNDIVKKATEFENVNNFYFKTCEYAEGGVTIYEYWIKDSNGRRYSKTFNSNLYVPETQQVLKDGMSCFYQDGELTDTSEEKRDVVEEFCIGLEDLKETFSNPLNLFTISVETVKFNNKVCYKISPYDGSYVYIEKKTGLPVRSEEWYAGPLAGEAELGSWMIEYEYKFDCVTDKDLEFDDGKGNVYEPVTKTAKFGETTSITDNNFNIEISNLNYDKDKNSLSTDIKFSTEDGEGVSTYILYDYIVYDANSNILGTSLTSGMNENKRNLAEKFAMEHYQGIKFSDFTSHIIGYMSPMNNMTEEGKIHHSFFSGELYDKPNLETLTIFITNVRYKNLGEPETIEPKKDYIFNFN